MESINNTKLSIEDFEICQTLGIGIKKFHYFKK